ncbi:hypothetical protein RLEG12_04885 (plasmid) [Rhizobium leguminosarum bv. trifolii CB782]|uniref:hypothetical protein n=1 Tax=Rhizobium hidalgonense TaxID=1538159 RepID=UPI00027D36A7|nr:hypothetical protein [Rhizobium hidalgonense]AHG48250.1 hypothetical protein RLEG12_04885 [Rhizobium leguminosarum bv. trifolii CB782]EJC72251.1 hypothetical protein Rleg10DRAFT_0657 [Rhizobium leguminosarum bv. trifolii WSM2012]QKK26254.1 hypothetical protein FFM81_023015 [Rhizobium hidalgonense]
MAVVFESGLARRGGRRATASLLSQLGHAAGLCTITASFTFLFALVIGLIR